MDLILITYLIITSMNTTNLKGISKMSLILLELVRGRETDAVHEFLRIQKIRGVEVERLFTGYANVVSVGVAVVAKELEKKSVSRSPNRKSPLFLCWNEQGAATSQLGEEMKHLDDSLRVLSRFWKKEEDG